MLGSGLIYPESYYEIGQELHADDFYVIRNQWLWESFTRLHDRRIPIDILTVSQDLEERNQLTEIGGQSYLLALVNQTPTALHAEAYAQIVEQNAVRRRMLASANELAKLAYDQEKPIDSVINEAEKSIFGLSERRVKHDLVPISQVVSDAYDHVSELSQRSEEIFGVPTGLYDLDKVLGGLQKSDLLIVAGRPGMGKTGFLLSVAKNAAQRHRKHVAMFSLEMSNEQLVQRLIAQETNIDTQRLAPLYWQTMSGNLYPGLRSTGHTPFWLDDTPAIPAAASYQMPHAAQETAWIWWTSTIYSWRHDSRTITGCRKSHSSQMSQGAGT